jgi:phage terminase Nu1 subunit (DNA packaging protein)
MRQSELAKLWGISGAAINKLVKAGMPLTSEAEAQSWKIANQKRVGRKQLLIPAPSQTSSEPLRESDAESYKSKTSLGRLNRAKQAEVVAYSLVATAANNQNPVAMRSAVQGWGEAKKRVAEAEMEHARFEEVTRVLVRMDEVREVFGKWLGAIRNLMDAMPSSLAARANPSDPECAKRAIQEGIDQIFVTIQKAEGAFK